MPEIRIDSQSLEAFVAAIFERAGFSAEDASTEAHVLVWANLRGVDSHGVLRVRQYLANIRRGGMNPHARIRVERETPAIALVEADCAFGPVVTTYAMNLAIEKARQIGIGWVVIRNTTHQGCMAYYPMMAVEQDMAGLALVCNPPNMAPYGARAAGVHNSPLAIAVPAQCHDPLVLDMATSMAAFGKVNLAQDKGIPIPEGWALDAEGNPTTDPNQARILLPFGGYKASSLALMFETLSSVMAGNGVLTPFLVGGDKPRPGAQNSVVAAINIAAFTEVPAFKAEIDRLIEGIKGLPTAEGFSEVLVPGEIENRVRAERSAQGVPLPEGTVANLREAARELGVELPAALLP
ncbi:MAG: Ldh family oxidoreductase [Anaerolineae bacterium]|jgi:ureidoglycolate dehydrogenase (NAD+)|nr:Ldh family oxidoreductase [Chloroflexota bacterium]